MSNINDKILTNLLLRPFAMRQHVHQLHFSTGYVMQLLTHYRCVCLCLSLVLCVCHIYANFYGRNYILMLIKMVWGDRINVLICVNSQMLFDNILTTGYRLNAICVAPSDLSTFPFIKIKCWPCNFITRVGVRSQDFGISFVKYCTDCWHMCVKW